MAALFKKRTRASAQQDPGLQQINAWLEAFTIFNEDRLRAWPDGPVLDAERATVAALGTAIVARLRAEDKARPFR